MLLEVDVEVNVAVAVSVLVVVTVLVAVRDAVFAGVEDPDGVLVAVHVIVTDAVPVVISVLV